MRKVYLALLCVLLISCLFPTVAAEDQSSSFRWTDDFDYTSLDEMNETGWTLEGPTHTSLEQGLYEFATWLRGTSATSLIALQQALGQATQPTGPLVHTRGSAESGAQDRAR